MWPKFVCRTDVSSGTLSKMFLITLLFHCTLASVVCCQKRSPSFLPRLPPGLFELQKNIRSQPQDVRNVAKCVCRTDFSSGTLSKVFLITVLFHCTLASVVCCRGRSPSCLPSLPPGLFELQKNTCCTRKLDSTSATRRAKCCQMCLQDRLLFGNPQQGFSDYNVVPLYACQLCVLSKALALLFAQLASRPV